MPKQVTVNLTTREVNFLRNLVLQRMGYLMSQEDKSGIVKELEIIYRELSLVVTTPRKDRE